MDVFTIFGPYIYLYILGFGVAEYIWIRRQRRPYNWQESLVSLADMVIRRVVYFFMGGALLLTVGPWLSRFSWTDLPVRVADQWQWGRVAALFLGVEFFYYWNHRLSHEIRWFWATHAVHHSPNTMNMLTAERLGWTQSLSGTMLIYSPLVLIGFRPIEILGMLGINLAYQFWLHTEMIGQLGWFERVFNTPSHHRVHHGSNPRYLDKNYGGVLILFDRLFGTLAIEDKQDKVVFGLVKPLHSLNPIYIALHEWIHIWHDVRRNWRHPGRLAGYLFGRPGWSHDNSRQTSSSILASRPYATINGPMKDTL